MKFSQLPTQGELRSKLNYDPQTGELRWAVDVASTCPTGTLAGTVNRKGYMRLKFGNKAYLAHRIIWKWMTGEDPPQQIDHIDLNKANNSWCNLRTATNSQNQMNRKAMGNHGLPKGVSFHKRIGKYQVRVKKDGVRHHLGYFEDVRCAADAYRAAATLPFGSFARTA